MSTALVTGATAGIGHAFAESLALSGHDLVLVARDDARLEVVAAHLRAIARVQVEVLPADLSDPDQRATVETRLADRDQPVDVLVNNAGFGVNTPFASGSIEDEQRQLDVLVTAVMRLTHAVVPGMVERSCGTVLNVGSVAAWTAGGTYSAAKAWVTVFSESLRRELAGTGVGVTVVAPGLTHTEFHQRAGMDLAGVGEWAWLDVDEVVRTALADARKGRAVSVPGLQYKAASLLLKYLPRGLVVRASGLRPSERGR